MRRIASCSTAPSGTGRYSPFEHGPSLIGSSSSGSHAIAAHPTSGSTDFCATSPADAGQIARKSAACALRRRPRPRDHGGCHTPVRRCPAWSASCSSPCSSSSPSVPPPAPARSLVSRQAADAPAAPDPEDIANRIAQRAAQQQQAALGHLIETNRALLDAERTRSGEALASERNLIEAQFGNVSSELDKVTALVREFESGRGAKIDELSGALAAAARRHRRAREHRAGPARGAREQQDPWPVGRAHGRRRAAARRLRRGRAVPQAEGGRAGQRHPRLHVPAPAGRDPLHGREVPARQLRAVRQRRVRARAGALPRRLREGRAGKVKELAQRDYPHGSDAEPRLRPAVHPERAALRVRPGARELARSTTRCATGS